MDDLLFARAHVAELQAIATRAHARKLATKKAPVATAAAQRSSDSHRKDPRQGARFHQGRITDNGIYLSWV